MQEKQEMWVQYLGWEDPLEEGMAMHSSFLAWRIPCTERNLMGYSSWGRKELYMTEQLNNKVFSARAVKLLLLFSRSVMSDSLQLHGLQHTRPPCPSPTPGV